jgi:hypothetical protein
VVQFIACKRDGFYLSSFADGAWKDVSILWQSQLKHRRAPEACSAYHEAKFTVVVPGGGQNCMFRIEHGAASARC